MHIPTKKKHIIPALIILALCAMGQSSSCRAPLDANGSYSGTWSFDILDNGTVIDTIDCQLAMTLNQNVSASPPNNFTVNGALDIDFSCFDDIPNWPEWVDMPDNNTIKVTGTMEPGGKLLLASAGCTTGACAILMLDGRGAGDNQTQSIIPAMESYTGSWGFALGVAFLSPAGVAGRFEVARQ